MPAGASRSRPPATLLFGRQQIGVARKLRSPVALLAQYRERVAGAMRDASDRRSRKWVIRVIFFASTPNDSSEMMTIGGLVGRPDQWHYFDRRWAKMLKKRSIPYFHTKSLLDTKHR